MSMFVSRGGRQLFLRAHSVEHSPDVHPSDLALLRAVCASMTLKLWELQQYEVNAVRSQQRRVCYRITAKKAHRNSETFWAAYR